jgi:transposase
VGKCDSAALEDYLDTLAAQCALPTVVVMDNAGSHKAKRITQRLEEWAAKGLRLYFLPAYCPHLNLVERWWKTLKGLLMRRCYDSVAEMTTAMLAALNALQAIPI